MKMPRRSAQVKDLGKEVEEKTKKEVGDYHTFLKTQLRFHNKNRYSFGVCVVVAGRERKKERRNRAM
jgi:hypothetical protein